MRVRVGSNSPLVLQWHKVRMLTTVWYPVTAIDLALLVGNHGGL